MANFTAGTSFTDGVTNDVTAAKLNALVADAVPTSSLSLNSTTGTIANFTASTANITLGTIPTLTAGTTTGTTGVFTSGTITTGVIPTLTAGTTTSTNAVVTNGTITNLSATTSTFLGTITGSTNVVNIGSGQIYKDASGNVGIGTTSPGEALHINGSTNLKSAIRLQNQGTDVGFIATEAARLGSGSSNNLSISSFGTNSVVLATGTTERFRIDSSGNVGIGTTSPDSVLSVYANNKTTPAISARYSSAGFKAGLSVYNSLGFPYLSFNSNPVSGTDNATYDINGAASKIDFATGATTANIVFSNAASGTAGSTISWSERMRIDSSGNVGIGTASPSAQLELSTDSAKKPSTNTWTIASDQRLKTNITNADNDRCYEIVKQVPLKRYTWRSEVYSEGQVKDRSKLGWIAQDVEAVFPKAVGTNRFAYNQVFEDVVTPELDSDGNAVLDENGVAKTKTEKRLVSEDVIEDCKDLNSDQIYAAMYGTIQKLIEKVEFLESKVATLEAD
jgi:hypothetical protein